MRTDKFGQQIFNKDEITDILMRINNTSPGPFLVENINNIEQINELVGYEAFIDYSNNTIQTIKEFDESNQSEWFMPTIYKEMDIAKYILDLCDNQAELQRCGEELLMYQDRDLFNLLRYLVYLVDKMEAHNIIWGVGRGSSVASFVLYKLKIHRVNSMYYKLSIDEFLR